MTEKFVIEDYVVSGVSWMRQQTWYPTTFRIIAGLYHEALSILYGIAAIETLTGKDAALQAGRLYGLDIHINGRPIPPIALGIVSICFAALTAFAGYSLMTARREEYWYLVLLNLAAFLCMVFLVRPSHAIQWVQAGIALLIVLILLRDPYVKAFYSKGPLAAERSQIDEQGRG